jgi:autotransporter-associated beta strand protein
VAQPINFEPTGAWTTWNTIALPVTLTAGPTNTIRFESTGEDLGNLDLVWPASLPEAVATAEVVSVAAGEILVDASTRSGDLPLVKQGAGTLVLAAAASMTGGVAVSEGSLVVQAVDALGSGGLTVSSGEVRLEVGYGTVPLASLELAGGRLDLGSGSVSVAAGGYDLAAVKRWLAAGRNGGGWNGATGIVSRAAGTAALREIGYAVNGGVLTIGWAAPGDANLDGAVNVFDMASVLSRGLYGGSGSAAGWSDGDFNYDGRVSLVDLVQITGSGLFNAPGYRTGGGTGPETGRDQATISTASSQTLAAFALLAAEAEGADDDEPGFL